MKEFRRIFYILIYDIHCNHDPMQSLSLLCNVLFGWIIFLTEGYYELLKLLVLYLTVEYYTCLCIGVKYMQISRYLITKQTNEIDFYGWARRTLMSILRLFSFLFCY